MFVGGGIYLHMHVRVSIELRYAVCNNSILETLRLSYPVMNIFYTFKQIKSLINRSQIENKSFKIKIDNNKIIISLWNCIEALPQDSME